MKYLCTLMFLLMMPIASAQSASLYSSVREGVDLYEKQQYEEALKTFLDAQVENPESAVLKFDIASCQYKLQKYEEAATGYLDVVATARDADMETQALYNLGNAMYRQGKLEDAVEYYKKTLALDPEDEDASKNLEFVREEIKRRMNEAQDTQKRQKDGQKDGQQDQQESQQPGQSEDQKDSSQDSQKQDDSDGSKESQQDSQQQQGQGSPDGEPDEGMQEPGAQAGQQDGSQQTEEDLRDIAGGERPMSAEEAEQWLRGIDENREKLQQFRRQSQPGKSRRPEKDL
jgi:Ca-activated chloride channel family protein